MRRSTLLVLGFALVAGACGDDPYLLGGQPLPPPDPSITTGEAQVVATAAVGAAGGEIQVEAPGSALEGLIITVPAGAYDTDIQFTISEAPVLSHDYGDDFDPATPLITIANGGVFAAMPLQVAIPIRKDPDEFAMGFFYDPDTGELEGIPFLSLTDESIVLYTSHFSHIVVSRTNMGRIRTGPIETGFRPGWDDFQTTNYGSYLSRGHCAGQSIAAMHYFQKRGVARVTDQQRLYGRFDNEGFEKTPDFWLDDVSVVRLSSAVQRVHRGYWQGNREDIKEYKRSLGRDDEATFYTFAYAIQKTGQPQFVAVFDGEGKGHALIAYAVSGDEILVADPNFPGDGTRRIVLDRGTVEEPRRPPKFQPYMSGANADEVAEGGRAYHRIGYFGVSALVDERAVDRYWEQVLAGGPVAAELFPPDVRVEVAVDRDDEGRVITATLTDGLVLTSGGTAKLGDRTEGVLYLRAVDPDEDDAVVLYFGTERIGAIHSDLEWTTFSRAPLAPGENDIGIFYGRFVDGEDGARFVNFQRFRVFYTAGPDPGAGFDCDNCPPGIAGLDCRVACEQIGDTYNPIPPPTLP